MHDSPYCDARPPLDVYWCCRPPLKPTRSFDHAEIWSSDNNVYSYRNKPPLKPTRSFDHGAETRSGGDDDFRDQNIVVVMNVQQQQEPVQIEHSISTHRPPLNPTWSFDSQISMLTMARIILMLLLADQRQLECCTISSHRPPLKPTQSFDDYYRDHHHGSIDRHAMVLSNEAASCCRRLPLKPTRTVNSSSPPADTGKAGGTAADRRC
jgi:hypothetical protein